MEQEHLNHSVFLHSSMIIFTIFATRRWHEGMDILIATSTTQIFEFPNFEGAKGSTPMVPPIVHISFHTHHCGIQWCPVIRQMLHLSQLVCGHSSKGMELFSSGSDITLYYFLLKLGHLNHLVSFTLGHVPFFFHFCATISGSSINLGTSNPPR